MQDLALGVVTEADIVEADRHLLCGQRLRGGMVIDLGADVQQREHALHVGQ
ncbi:hypothetical protein D3C84_1252870 [compost metagenome]